MSNIVKVDGQEIDLDNIQTVMPSYCHAHCLICGDVVKLDYYCFSDIICVCDKCKRAVMRVREEIESEDNNQ